MTQRFYFDTSVFGGMYDNEFEKETTLLFEKVSLGQIICVYSNLTESELSHAPDNLFHYSTFHKSLLNAPLRRTKSLNLNHNS